MDWQQYYADITPDTVGNILARIPPWQEALTARIRALTGTGRLLEAGSGFGVTSLLVGPQADRVLLDLIPTAMRVAKAEFAKEQQSASFIAGDLFHLPFPPATFEVVFNAGVIEHFAFEERRAALAEMVRVTRPGGYLVVAYPNMYSLPYRTAYRYRTRRGKWRYPEVEVLYDLVEELKAIPKVQVLSRETCDVRSSLRWLKGWQRVLFLPLRVVMRFEGYLTILTLQKAST